MGYANYSPREVETRGEEIYERSVRAQVEQTHLGEFVVIDITSGDFEVDPEDLQATKRLLEKRPEAVLYGLRIGYRSAYTLGGHGL